MKCVRCNEEIGTPKKYQIIKCTCGVEQMLIEINGKKSLQPMYREEKKQ